MDKLLLKAYERNDFGKNASHRLRKTGKIPAVIYGANKAVHISLDEQDFIMKFRHISNKTIVPLEINDKKIEVLVQDYQHDIVRDKIVHIDLYEFVRSTPLKVKVPLKFVGEPIGLREGGVIDQKEREIEVETMKRFIPNLIEVDISSLKKGDSINVGALKAPENVKFTQKANEVVVALV
jgi:large subunit ribosomal protein L25